MSWYFQRCRYLVPALLLCCSVCAFAQSGTTKTVTGAGGVDAAGSAIAVTGTIGQPLIGPVGGANRLLGQGFWYAESASNAVSSVMTEAEVALQLACSPNPVNGPAHVTVSAPNNHPLTLSLHDMLGREVRSLLIGERASGSQTLDLDTENLPAGQYRLVLTSGSDRTALPVTVVR